MTLDEEKAWVLWPEYFDINRTRDAGRKVCRKLSISNPNVELIAKAVKQMGLEYKIESDKSYPGNWYNHAGRVLVEHSLPKTLLLLKVGQALVKYQRS
jgi:signal recognition particle subunit SRP19